MSKNWVYPHKPQDLRCSKIENCNFLRPTACFFYSEFKFAVNL